MDEKEELNNNNNENSYENENNSEEYTAETKKPLPEDVSVWEEVTEDNSVVKKYIVYISKDFIPLMDKMSTDKRSAYINDAIQKKIDSEDEKKQKFKKIRLALHLILMIVVAISFMPFAILGANKAIMVTFENYKYSQDNFEKLYKHHFEKTKIYSRSLQYNLEKSKKQ